jgi:hypothetical protein
MKLRAFRPVVLIFTAFVGVQGVSAALLFAMKLGLTPSRIEQFYLGSAMARPRSLSGLLEVAIPHLLAVPLTLFIIIHLVSWGGVLGRDAVRLLTRVSFFLVGVGAVAGLGVRFVWPALSVVKLTAFLGVELTLAAWCLLLLRVFWRPEPAAAVTLPGGAPAS